MTEIIWQSETNPLGDFVQVTRNPKTDAYAVIISGSKRTTEIVVLTRTDIETMMREVGAHIVVSKIRETEAHPEGCEPYEKSEKDALWERGD